MQVELAVRGGDVLFDQRILVRRQSINHPMHSFLPAVHQLFQQFYKQFAGAAALVGCKPERPLGIDG